MNSPSPFLFSFLLLCTAFSDTNFLHFAASVLTACADEANKFPAVVKQATEKALRENVCEESTTEES